MALSRATGRAALVTCAAGIAVCTGLVAADNAATASGTTGAVAAGRSVGVGTEVSPDVSSQALALLKAHRNADMEISRSSERPPLRRIERVTKTSALEVSVQNLKGSRHEKVPPPSPREIALSLLPSYGWDSGQFSCLDSIWTRESDWNPRADNSTSGAYGIPQALPGAKMATAGSDWQWSAETQIRWGLSYIRASYGSPCGAWYFWESHDWY